ncbi:MAG: endopeptidase La [Lachnospiraceae bacterium]|nr:endopeptidase La [Lachnospiraceae bacterium]
MSDLTKELPVVALRGMTILPSMIVHFDISREKSMTAVEQAMLDKQELFVVTQKDPEAAKPGQSDLYRVGTVVMIKQLMRLPNNILRVLVEGIARAELLTLDENQKYLLAEVAVFEEMRDGELDEHHREAMLRTLKEIYSEYALANPKISKELTAQLMETGEVSRLVDQIAIHLPLYYEEKQRILEAVSLTDRYDLLCEILSNEVEIMQIKADLQEKVKARIDKNQKEYILREQLKLIREELGEDHTFSDADHFKEAAEKLKAPKAVKEKILKEIQRFKNVAGNSSESAVSRGYIETLLELPWDKESKDNKDLKNAREILEADHYGLEKVKERVLEFLAVRTLTKKGESPILCLVGPPGTGKTSIAKSIARAMNKKYVRISLGGVRDEAEIRGHRRTYVGAMPGRIANGMKMAGVKNPLMLLDEIDKVSSDYKGDTSSALLEVLDSEQNVRFRDHYVEIPLDLSEVMFIATANDVQTIPKPLLDRMELIEISSYTENEKFHIAKEHLLQKQIRRHGLDVYDFTITNGALKKIIASYTREAGVRNLERKIGEICRKAAREILEDGKKSLKVSESGVEKYLGPERYSVNRVNKEDEIGIVRGLAWTSVGGDTLEIEVNVMPGKGEIQLTGQLGDVMKESAKTGISYIRSVSREYGIEEDFFQKHDIHIHIPEGAVPKDGPSAGITMATAILSAVTMRKVRADVAMTGEITLRGRVLPVGGLKEKLLAAKNAGIKRVLIPKKNKVDVEEISKEIKKGMELVFVESMGEVLPVALVK